MWERPQLSKIGWHFFGNHEFVPVGTFLGISFGRVLMTFVQIIGLCVGFARLSLILVLNCCFRTCMTK